MNRHRKARSRLPLLLIAATVLGVALGASVNLEHDAPTPAAQTQPAQLSTPTPPAVHPAPVEATPAIQAPAVHAPAAHAAKPAAKHATKAKAEPEHRVARATHHHQVHKHHTKHRHEHGKHHSGHHHKHGKRHSCH